MKVLDIVREYLVLHGHLGLFNEVNCCACRIKDLGKCDSLYQDCQVALYAVDETDPRNDSTKVIPISTEEPIWAQCKRTHTQACHICEDASCADNANPALHKKR